MILALLSVGAIYAIIPLIIVVALIVAAAGLARGTDIFALLGIASLMGLTSGMTGGRAKAGLSRGSRYGSPTGQGDLSDYFRDLQKTGALMKGKDWVKIKHYGLLKGEPVITATRTGERTARYNEKMIAEMERAAKAGVPAAKEALKALEEVKKGNFSTLTPPSTLKSDKGFVRLQSQHAEKVAKAKDLQQELGIRPAVAAVKGPFYSGKEGYKISGRGFPDPTKNFEALERGMAKRIGTPTKLGDETFLEGTRPRSAIYRSEGTLNVGPMQFGLRSEADLLHITERIPIIRDIYYSKREQTGKEYAKKLDEIGDIEETARSKIIEDFVRNAGSTYGGQGTSMQEEADRAWRDSAEVRLGDVPAIFRRVYNEMVGRDEQGNQTRRFETLQNMLEEQREKNYGSGRYPSLSKSLPSPAFPNIETYSIDHMSALREIYRDYRESVQRKNAVRTMFRNFYVRE
ncbi:MAG: hypothetical protein KGH98_02200, partial [Candidatus Micrarchaeota archaeon]|nr:hypothetical protein [Candidatus Micrarchaeota archaeon]